MHVCANVETAVAAQKFHCLNRKSVRLQVEYKPDFRQEIAATWPQSIDDSRARADWNWRHRFDIDQMTEDMLAAMLLKYKPEVAGGCAVPETPDSTKAKKLAA